MKNEKILFLGQQNFQIRNEKEKLYFYKSHKG